MRYVKSFFAVLAAVVMTAGCTKGGYLMDSERGGFAGMADAAEGAGGGEGGEQNGNGQAGMVTAGEWRDLDHWGFFSDLMKDEQTSESYVGMPQYWSFYPDNMVAVHVSGGGKPAVGTKVSLASDQKTVWEAVTDNHGYAYLFPSAFRVEKAGKLTVSVAGKAMEGSPAVSSWAERKDAVINEYEVNATEPGDVTDIAFIVDATGSMSDEINFLKSDLLDILGKVSGLGKIRTAALFYRDQGDEYVTRTSDFSEDSKKTTGFISEQWADGGGDYPEAVHTALEVSLQELSWSEDARMKVAFMLLDAPAHHNEQVIASLQKSIKTYAAMGIRLVPIAASGVNKQTEFMLRFFDILTGATYVFITNDSGIGNDHIAASVGDYKVELLNELIVRLITSYME